MSMWTTLKNNMPWTVYAERKTAKELVKLGHEIGIFKDTKYEMKDQEDINPDTFGIDVWDKMLTDGQVKAGLDTLKLSVTARGYTLTGTSEESKEYADFLTEMFESIEGNLEDNIIEMLSALEYGYSVTEKVFDKDKQNRYVLKKLKTLNPNSLALKTDKFGNILYARQRIGLEDIKIPPDKVIVYSHDKRFGNPYGRSILRTAYKHWLIKDKLYRFANIAYERYGTPLLVGKVQDANDVEKMDRILSRINSMTTVSIPMNDDVKAINMQSADFIGYIEYHDRKILTSLGVPPMILEVGRGQSGSYALTGNQLDIFMNRLEAIQREVKYLIEEQIIRPLVDINFPNVKGYPSFNFKPLADDDIQKLATVYVQMIQSGIMAPSEEWIRERLGMPPMSEETKKEIEQEKTQRQQLAKEAINPEDKSPVQQSLKQKKDEETNEGKQ